MHRLVAAGVRLVVGLLVAVVAVLGAARGAAAHGMLRTSAPAADARLDEAPRALRLTFTETIEVALARLDLLGPGGEAVAISPLRRGESPAVLVADVAGPLAAGTYTVAWQVVGRDGHPVRGRFAFTVLPGAAGLAAVGPATPAARAPTPDRAPAAAAQPGATTFDAASPLYAAVRWLGYLGMLGVIGAVAFARFVLPRARWQDDPGTGMDASGALAVAARVGAARVGAAAATLLLAAAALRLVAQAAALHGDHALDASLVRAMLASTLWGTGWLLQVGAAALALVGFALVLRGRAAGWAAAAVGGAAGAVALALAGHAAAHPTRATVAMAADALHVLAAGGWIGTLLVLVAVGLPAARRAPAPDRAAHAAALVRAFTPLALGCAGLVVLTGAAAAWLQVGSVAALLGSTYGRTLLGKLAAVAAIAALGAYNWRRGRAGLATEGDAAGVRRAAAGELVAGAVVLALTAVLVALPTPAS